MTLENNSYHYRKVAEAIDFIDANFKNQPSLDEVADHIHLSPFHFQRLFVEWVGISPKKYLQFIGANYAKSLLRNSGATLFDAAIHTGLSGTGRLHDLFVAIEGMTPGEYQHGGANLNVNYNFAGSPFGEMIVASTSKGICYIAFIDDHQNGLNDLRNEFPNAVFNQKADPVQQNALSLFHDDWSNLNQIKLHLKGTDFQIKVWETLLFVPYGRLSTYSNIAKAVNRPKASRAVGTAIGSNPVAFLIPCHRIIQQSGNLGGYRWDVIRKKAIIGWEASKTNRL